MNDGVHTFTKVTAKYIHLIKNYFCPYSFKVDKRALERIVYVADKTYNYYSQFYHPTYTKKAESLLPLLRKFFHFPKLLNQFVQ